MTCQSWGGYPAHQCDIMDYQNEEQLFSRLQSDGSLICFGNGRSYGDSALNERVLLTRQNNCLLSFDSEKGILTCQSGVLLSDILDVFVNRGWFLPVTPGTKYVTVGGAISSDVHGKNQHKAGTFGQYVLSLNLAMPDGQLLYCSPKVNSELYYAVCGGMGLLGVIVDATIQLLPVQSSKIEQSIVRTANLDETISVLEQNDLFDYSVAWIDCLQRGKNLGRGVVNLGNHSASGDFDWKARTPVKLPFAEMIGALSINKFAGQLFNHAYFQANKGKSKLHTVDMNAFFYPLDGIMNWNRLYGKSGFIQYQFVIPKKNGLDGLTEVLTAISRYGKGCYLAVLKVFEQENSRYLSFPISGYTLAVDFKVEPGVFEFLQRLDKIVLAYRGRFYLAKDSRVKRETFEAGYPEVEAFRALRKKYRLSEKIQSYQSLRLAL